MVDKSESAPGQLARAIKGADPRSRAGAARPRPVISHGHEGDDTPGPLPALLGWPDHLLREGNSAPPAASSG